MDKYIVWIEKKCESEIYAFGETDDSNRVLNDPFFIMENCFDDEVELEGEFVIYALDEWEPLVNIGNHKPFATVKGNLEDLKNYLLAHKRELVK